jgi:radical SAM protein with 4Fe4S-binding SPASM domain
MGEILEIKCHNCSAKNTLFVGGGMNFSITKIYHCQTCDVIIDKTFYGETNPFSLNYNENLKVKFEDVLNAKQICPKCKIEKLRCGKCKEKKQNNISPIPPTHQ